MDVADKYRIAYYKKVDKNEFAIKTDDDVPNTFGKGQIKGSESLFPSDEIAGRKQDIEEDKVAKIDLSTTKGNNCENSRTINKIDEVALHTKLQTNGELFSEIVPTQPLEDKRRSRAKSIGRSPSRLFVKNILLKPEDIDTNEFVDRDKFGRTNEHPKLIEVTKLVYELRNKTNLNQEADAATNGIQSKRNTEVPSWMKVLKNKQRGVSTFLDKVEDLNAAPSWLQELKKRKQHRLSLKSDDLTTLETSVSKVNHRHSIIVINNSKSSVNQSSVRQEVKREHTRYRSSPSMFSGSEEITNVSTTKIPNKIDTKIVNELIDENKNYDYKKIANNVSAIPSLTENIKMQQSNVFISKDAKYDMSHNLIPGKIKSEYLQTTESIKKISDKPEVIELEESNAHDQRDRETFSKTKEVKSVVMEKNGNNQTIHLAESALQSVDNTSEYSQTTERIEKISAKPDTIELEESNANKQRDREAFFKTKEIKSVVTEKNGDNQTIHLAESMLQNVDNKSKYLQFTERIEKIFDKSDTIELEESNTNKQRDREAFFKTKDIKSVVTEKNGDNQTIHLAESMLQNVDNKSEYLQFTERIEKIFDKPDTIELEESNTQNRCDQKALVETNEIKPAVIEKEGENRAIQSAKSMLCNIDNLLVTSKNNQLKLKQQISNLQILMKQEYEENLAQLSSIKSELLTLINEI